MLNIIVLRRRRRQKSDGQGYDLGSLGEEEDRLLLVHPNLPTVTSQALGVPTLMSRMLEVEELDFSFGQTDSLTHRLHVLLEEYVDGFAVPKELVQNADDAGATCIKILYDERQNQDCRTCLIDEGMRECQGPALWAYNDAVFTEHDFDNITKLSGATKEQRTDQIGRFGLGFNAVYNVTDVPSFVSKNNIVIFDPHTTHLGKSIKNKSKPGIKIDMLKHRRKLRRLGNQFKPYNEVFGCDLRPESNQDVYNGTLFRLPLRTKVQAVKSEICQRHYDDAEVKILLKLLMSGAESLLMFTQNVVEIHLYHLPPHGHRPSEAIEVFSIHKESIRVIKELLPIVPLPETTQKLSKSKLEAVKQSGSLKAGSKVLKSVRSGVNLNKIVTPNSATLMSFEQRLTETGSRLFRLRSWHKSKPWLVTSFMGLGESLQLALPEDSLVPMTGVAVPLEYHQASQTYKPVPILDKDNNPCGSVFTYLPLPIHSGLPVHINGTFAITSNRRYLCEKSEEDKFDMRAIWNESLLKDAVSQAYINALKYLSLLSPHSEDGNYQLWPQIQHVETNCQALTSNFYRKLNDSQPNSNPKLFSDGSKWVGIEHACFLGEDILHSNIKQDAIDVFRKCKEEEPSIITEVPNYIREGFHQANSLEMLTSNTFDMTRFFTDIFLPNILNASSNNRNRLIRHVLMTDLTSNQELFHSLKSSPCIPATPNGSELRKPTDLIDPESTLSKLYSKDDGRFPDSMFQSKEILQALRHLGMSTADISWNELLERAKSIDAMKEGNVHKRITTLLSCIESKLEENETNIENIKSMFCDIPFLPLSKRPAHFPMQWKGKHLGYDTLVKPNDAYPYDLWGLVGCVEPVIDETIFPHNAEKVKGFLGITKSVTLEIVLKQLDIISDESTEKLLKDKDVNNELFRVCFQIYGYLQNKCSQSECITQIQAQLHESYFILSQERFLSPKQVAFEFSHNCAPYLFALPDLYKRNFSELLTVVGVRHQFETFDYVHALQGMHATFNGNILSREHLKLALQLVNLLNDSMQDLNQTLSTIVADCGTIYIPDAAGALRASSELCFNEPDCQWVPTTGYINYSHANIPFAISKQLGVNTKRQEVLRKHSKGIPFGQRERLPVRLKRILSSYPCDKEIFKELLQNADDAGASEIHFIKDPRQHGVERVFDDSWKPLQGPALCVYNNTPFTDADMAGIQKLGEGSKGTDPNKTGQYGVGFNSVYHLTDAPSFLTSSKQSGQSLCIFDPQAKFVPGATLQEPGRRYDEVTELREIFSDIFPCYLENMYNISNGTMFRFPLRTPKMAEDSELSEQAISLDMIDTLLSKFKNEIFDCLLFVNNVSSITLTEIDKRKQGLTNSYTVHVEMTEKDNQQRKEFAEYIANLSESVKQGTLTLANIKMKSVTYSLTIRDNKGCHQKWLVTQQVGFPQGTEIPYNLLDIYRRQELALLPRGGVAALLESSDSEMARRPKRAFSFLPLPLKTELPVHINGHFALDHESRRNLWQDDEKSTKSEWNFLLLKKVISPAYVSLLKHIPENIVGSALSPGMSFILEDTSSIDLLSDLLPRFHSTDIYWSTLVKGVYRHINNYQEPLLPVVRQANSFYSLSKSNMSSSSLDDTCSSVQIEWLPLSGHGSSRPFFDNLDSLDDSAHPITSGHLSRRRLTSTPKKKDKSDILRNVLLSSGFKLIRLPMDIFDCFHRSDVPVECVKPSAVIDFYRSYNEERPACTLGTLPCAIESTPFRDVNILKTLLEYCVEHDDQFFDNIDGLPLLLCQDSQVRQFSTENSVYLSPYHELLPGLTSMFTHQSLARSVFKDVDVDVCSAFLALDIPSFAGLLKNELKEQLYKLENKHTLWPAGNDSMPTERWIWLLWNFLNEKYEDALNKQIENNDKRELIRILLHPLRKWCLIPTKVFPPNRKPNTSQYNQNDDADRKERYLAPIGLSTTVIDFTDASIMSYPVRECLRKIGVPELDRKLLNDTKGIANLEEITSGGRVANFVSLIVGTMEQPKTVLHCLHYAFNIKGNKGLLKPEECFLILKYFNDSLGEWIEDDEARNILINLPLYFTVHGDIISLSRNECYALPSEIPQADMDAWEKQKGIVFLRTNSALMDLYKRLGCSHLSVTEVYSKLIFKNFEFLSPEARIIHLQFIKDSKLPQLKGDERDQFIAELKCLEFLRDAEGILQPVFFFHDPHHPVYKVLMDGNKSAFPPAPFNEFKWLSFLRIIGLKHEVNQDHFIRFAESVAHEAIKSPNEGTFNKSRALVSYLFTMKDMLQGDFLEKLQDIKFIPAAKVSKSIKRICRSFTRDETDSDESSAEEPTPAYICFKEGIPETHEELVWTSSYLLPDWANPCKLMQKDLIFMMEGTDNTDFEAVQKEIVTKIGVQEEPAIDLVIQHAKHVCAIKIPPQKDHDDVYAYMKMNVMKRVYRFLQNKSQESDVIRNTLRDTPCIAVDLGQTFVKPKQVVINLYEEDQIIPYLFKAPIELGEFKELFLRLGATLNATADQYALVLENIYNVTGGSKLHPNEMRAAFKAVNELFTALEKHPLDAMFTEVLYLPSSSGRLIESTELVFNDEPSYTDRIRRFDKSFLVDLAECKLKARNYEDVVRLLPRHLRPVMLTSLIKEVLDQGCTGQGYNFGVTDKLKHQLNSKAFSNGVIRLIRHEHRRSGHRVKRSVIDRIQNDLKMINVIAIDKVITFLTYEQQMIPGSASEGECFADRIMLTNDENDSCWNIYLTNSVSLNEELLVSVADVVNKIAKGLLANSVHFLQPILSCAPHTVSKVLDRLRIRPDHSLDVKAPTLPTPGSFIPIEDHHLLRTDFVEFDPSEYVGLEIDDDDAGSQTVIYAIILEKLLEETTDEHGRSKLTQKYKVCVGEDHKTTIASAMDLYKFHRVQRLVSRGTSESESSFNVPNMSTSHAASPKHRPSFYEQSSIFEPATPAPQTDDVFDIPVSSTPQPRKRMFNRGQPSENERHSTIPEPVFEDEEPEEEEILSGRVQFRRRRKINRSKKRQEHYQKAQEPFKYPGPDAFEKENGYHDKNFQRQSPPQTVPTSVETNGEETQRESMPQYDEYDNPDDYYQPQNDQHEPFQQYSEKQTGQEEPTNFEFEVGTEEDEKQAPEEQSEAVKIFDEISDTLEEGWKLPEGQRKKIIKRLLLKWHPDKNIGNEEFSTIVTQHIQAEIERLELGLPRPGIAEKFAENYQFDLRNPFSGSSQFQKNFYNAYKDFYDKMERRAKEQREQRQRYKDNLYREYSTNNFDFDVPPTFSSSNPQPAQAKRFLKQAQEDLRAADNDYDVREPAFEWVCFKAHQAAEKALKAAQFSVDAVTSFSHDLASLAATVEDMELRRLSLKLQKIIGNSNKLYNPDPIDFVIIPHDEYSREMACDAIMCSSDILERVKEFVEMHSKE